MIRSNNNPDKADSIENSDSMYLPNYNADNGLVDITQR